MEFAVQAKMNMLEDEKQLAAFADELKKGGHEKLARMVRGFASRNELAKLDKVDDRSRGPEEGD